MNRLATAAVALLLLPLVAGCSNNAAKPSASAAPTPVPVLSAGTHTTAAFQPATTYTVPAGWTSPTDAADYFNLFPATDENNGLHVFHNPQPLSQDPKCPATAEPGAGAKAADLVAWIRSLKALNVSQPIMVTISGLQATQLDVSIHTDWTQSCSFAPTGMRTAGLFLRSSGLGWWLAGDEKARLYILDVPNQGTVVADLDSFTGDGFGDLLTQGAPIVQSLQFAK